MKPPPKKRKTASNRETLKNFFRQGSLPTEEHFGDLIDSTLNIIDDGFSQSADNGIEITRLGTKQRLISFFSQPEEQPDWSIGCDPDTKSLHFSLIRDQQDGDGKTGTTSADEQILTMTSTGLGVGKSDPDPSCKLDVAGFVRYKGRMGVAEIGGGLVPADGEWQSITPVLTGCQAFEVMAGVGLEGMNQGRYALLHAYAMNTFDPQGFFFNFLNLKNRIRCDHAWYRSRSDRLKLQWHKDEKLHHYTLQIKSGRDYTEGKKRDIRIQYSLTQLWFDETMHNSTKPRPPAEKA